MVKRVAQHDARVIAVGAIAIDHRRVAVVQEEADAEAEVLRHERPLDVQPTGGAGGGHEALAVEAVGACALGGGGGREERGQEKPAV